MLGRRMRADDREDRGLARPLSGCTDGGPPLAANQPAPEALAVDDEGVVWINADAVPPSIQRIAT